MRYSDYIDLSNCQQPNEPAWECPGTRRGFHPLSPRGRLVLDKASVSQFLHHTARVVRLTSLRTVLWKWVLYLWSLLRNVKGTCPPPVSLCKDLLCTKSDEQVQKEFEGPKRWRSEVAMGSQWAEEIPHGPVSKTNKAKSKVCLTIPSRFQYS